MRETFLKKFLAKALNKNRLYSISARKIPMLASRPGDGHMPDAIGIHASYAGAIAHVVAMLAYILLDPWYSLYDGLSFSPSLKREGVFYFLVSFWKRTSVPAKRIGRYSPNRRLAMRSPYFCSISFFERFVLMIVHLRLLMRVLITS